MSSYRFSWHAIGAHLFRVVKHFFLHSSLPRTWGQTYTAFISKQHSPNLVSNYRPISMYNVCYKIISKLLANRLKVILHKLINPEQCSFVLGMSSVDNILVALEITHSIEHDLKNTPRMMVKIDI